MRALLAREMVRLPEASLARLKRAAEYAFSDGHD